MSKYSEFRCEADVIKLLEQADLSLAALKLVHACYYLADQDRNHCLATMAVNKDYQITVLSADIMIATGSAGANDNRMIIKGIRDLAGKKIFDRIDTSQDCRKVRFRFSKPFLAATTKYKNGSFAMIDTDVLSKLRSVYQLLFYTQACKVERSNFPTFALPISEERPWTTTKRGWLRAASKLGPLLNHHYLFIPKLDRDQEKVAQVVVKISVDSKPWPAGNLYPRNSPEPVAIVVDGRHHVLSNSELRSRAQWRAVGGP